MNIKDYPKYKLETEAAIRHAIEDILIQFSEDTGLSVEGLDSYFSEITRVDDLSQKFKLSGVSITAKL